MGKTFSIKLAIKSFDFFSTWFQNCSSEVSLVFLVKGFLFIFLVKAQSLQGRDFWFLNLIMPLPSHSAQLLGLR